MSTGKGLGEWDTDLDSSDSRDQNADEEAPPPLYYGSVDEFVREMITPVFRRKVGERSALHWSARWWESAEAVIRLGVRVAAVQDRALSTDAERGSGW